MNRRNIIAAAAAFALSVPFVTGQAFAASESKGFVKYSPEALQNSLSAGETVFLDFMATWCSTCAAQGRVISALRQENPAYDQNITFMVVDWDTWKNSQIVADMSIPRRSTLVVLRGNQELGRIVAGTSPEQIGSLLDRALVK